MKADHCGFQVKDMHEATTFYTEKLGFHLDHRAVNQEEQEEYAFLSLGTARLELIQDLTKEYVIPAVKKPFCPHYCLEVSDMSAALADCQNNNILEYIQWFNKK